jgi:hypothetical protein
VEDLQLPRLAPLNGQETSTRTTDGAAPGDTWEGKIEESKTGHNLYDYYDEQKLTLFCPLFAT